MAVTDHRLVISTCYCSLGARECELLRDCAVGVSHLQRVAGFDSLSRLLADQCGLWVRIVVSGFLLLAIKQYYCAGIKLFTDDEQFLSRYRIAGYPDLDSLLNYGYVPRRNV